MAIAEAAGIKAAPPFKQLTASPAADAGESNVSLARPERRGSGQSRSVLILRPCLASARHRGSRPPPCDRQDAPTREGALMRHQHRHSHVLEELTAHTADQGFAKLRVVIAA